MGSGILIYAIPSAIAALVNAALFIYVYLANPKSKINMTWSLFLFFVFLLALGEFMSQMAGSDLRKALFWHAFFMLGVEVSTWLYFYFTLIFPGDLKFPNTRPGKIALAALFSLGMIIFIRALLREIFVPMTLEPNQWGFYSIAELDGMVAGALYVPVVLHLIFMILAGLVVLSWRYKKESAQNKRAILVVAGGAVAMYATSIITEFIFPLFSIPVIGLSNIGMTVMGIIIAYAIIKQRLFTIETVTEGMSSGVGEILAPGGLYYVKEDDHESPRESYRIFKEHVKSGIPGVIMTSRPPGEIRKKYGLEKTPIIYLTYEDTNLLAVQGPENVHYTNPSHFFDSVDSLEKFMSGGRERIVIVDCYDYLVRENSTTLLKRESLLRKYTTFTKAIKETGARLLTPVASSWINDGGTGQVIRAEGPLSNDNIWPVYLLERLCNLAFEGIDKKEDENVRVLLRVLAQKDDFFSNFRYDGGELTIGVGMEHRFTYNDTIRCFKEFARGLKPVLNIDVRRIKAELEKYGISPFEYDIEPGNVYLVYTSDEAQYVRLFAEFVRNGWRGLYIGRSQPDKFRSLPDDVNRGSKFVWLTATRDDADTIPPRLEHIQRAIEDYLEANRGRRNIVVLENISYLVKYTGSFDEVYLFIAKLRDIISGVNGILLLPCTGEPFTPDEKACLLQELSELYYTLATGESASRMPFRPIAIFWAAAQKP